MRVARVLSARATHMAGSRVQRKTSPFTEALTHPLAHRTRFRGRWATGTGQPQQQHRRDVVNHSIIRGPHSAVTHVTFRGHEFGIYAGVVPVGFEGGGTDTHRCVGIIGPFGGVYMLEHGGSNNFLADRYFAEKFPQIAELGEEAVAVFCDKVGELLERPTKRTPLAEAVS